MDRTVRAFLAKGRSVTAEDFADIAACESVEWGPGGELVVSFAGDLTPAEVLSVRLRCISVDDTEEAILTGAAQAFRANQAYLSTTPTNAQALAQVDALTRQVNGLLRYVTRITT